MTTRVHTVFSIYELEQAEHKIRKLVGVNPLTRNQRMQEKNEEGWQSYELVYLDGDGMMIVWETTVDASNHRIDIRRTFSSEIQQVEGEPLPTIQEALSNDS